MSTNEKPTVENIYKGADLNRSHRLLRPLFSAARRALDLTTSKGATAAGLSGDASMGEIGSHLTARAVDQGAAAAGLESGATMVDITTELTRGVLDDGYTTSLGVMDGLRGLEGGLRQQCYDDEAIKIGLPKGSSLQDIARARSALALGLPVTATMDQLIDARLELNRANAEEAENSLQADASRT